MKVMTNRDKSRNREVELIYLYQQEGEGREGNFRRRKR